MKITRVKIIEIKHRPLMAGLELFFTESTNDFICANCFVGMNGSGKSQFLETIAEIFLYLDRELRNINKPKRENPDFTFEIDYYIVVDKKRTYINISQTTYKSIDLEVNISDVDGKPLEIETKDLESYLPKKIIGYTSGENETLSTPFLSYYDEYASYTADRAFKDQKVPDYNPRFYLMDYNTNLGIAISNLIFEEFDGVKQLKKELKIDSIRSFQIIIQTQQTAAPKAKSVSGETGVVMTPELKRWRKELIECATYVSYDEDHEKYILDFFVDSATKKALKHYFKTAFNFYTVLYKFELLNNLIIDKKTRENIEKDRKSRKLVKKMPEVPDKDKVLNYSELKLKLTNGDVVDYLSLSDGEHQFINIFGTLLMTNDDNSIFLLDEPETHFNPIWRRLFISNLKQITNERNQDLYITSHSPFIVSDVQRDNVYIFERVSKTAINIKPPSVETFGSSFTNILKMVFAMDETISKEGNDFIEELLKSKKIEEIEKGMEKIGESSKLMSIYRRLELLKNNS
ncbi:restriction system-associated AAA family ATPase [Flavobacterium johnsoniae]|uniref:restriction system-associated AAA family ATPase n=1 Tax=Flavobacterium johnsoniae TaxID=986 RepID=UPI003D99566B